MNKIFKVNYKHVEQGDDITTYVYVTERELEFLDSLIKNFLVDYYHKYHSVEDSNGERSHGTFTYSYVEVSRKTDNDILKSIDDKQKEIVRFKEAITRFEDKIEELKSLLKTPYIEYDTN